MLRRVLCVLLMAGCARGGVGVDRPGTWVLVQPPEKKDVGAPLGVRLSPKAPLAQWQRADAFTTEPECRTARRKRYQRALDRAHRRGGEQARYDLDLRRAVHARCVPAERLAALRRE